MLTWVFILSISLAATAWMAELPVPSLVVNETPADSTPLATHAGFGLVGKGWIHGKSEGNVFVFLTEERAGWHISARVLALVVHLSHALLALIFHLVQCLLQCLMQLGVGGGALLAYWWQLLDAPYSPSPTAHGVLQARLRLEPFHASRPPLVTLTLSLYVGVCGPLLSRARTVSLVSVCGQGGWV